jgi:hypothetical protein
MLLTAGNNGGGGKGSELIKLHLCDEPGFSLRPGMLTSREAWRSAVQRRAQIKIDHFENK